MKRTIAWLLALCLCLTLLPTLTVAAQYPSVQRDCDRYNINDRNYFKLRDLAALFNGTANQFDVDYDAEAKAMIVTTGTAYSHPKGTELVVGPDQSKTAVASAQKLLVDGQERTGLTVWNIGDMTWVKVTEIDERGRVNLSRKDAIREREKLGLID